jgi:hypothetical protein
LRSSGQVISGVHGQTCRGNGHEDAPCNQSRHALPFVAHQPTDNDDTAMSNFRVKTVENLFALAIDSSMVSLHCSTGRR